MINDLLNIDCMEYMATIPDKYFDLAIVDPPYGININMNQGRRAGNIIKHERKNWDNKKPDDNYFIELNRVSNYQIIWGANNFILQPSNGWIVWDKDISGDVQFSKCELAYTNIKNTIDKILIRAQTGSETYSDKIHPTQKPIALYKWLLKNYAKPGDKLFDSHSGSGSFRIEAHDMGFDLVSCEPDPDYCKANEERFQRHIKQAELFEFVGGEIL